MSGNLLRSPARNDGSGINGVGRGATGRGGGARLTPLQRERNVRGFALRLVGLLVASYAVGLLPPSVAGESDGFRAAAPTSPSHVPDLAAPFNPPAVPPHEH